MTKTVLRVAGGLLLLYLAVVALSFLQELFDQGDLRKASHVIFEFRPAGGEGKTLIELMAAADGVAAAQVGCESELSSRYQGKVLMHCKTTADSRPFIWLIDVVAGSIEAQGERSRALIQTAH